MNPQPGRAYHSNRGHDGELSTLPSPSSSVVDLDSNAGTVETEVLLSTYKGSRPSASGIHSIHVQCISWCTVLRAVIEL